MASTPLSLTVRRQTPVLVPPSAPTPYEWKLLSDLDDHDGLRVQMPMIQFYRNNPLVRGRDPALVIKEAISKALVHYYPFAGRVRQSADSTRKLVVECTGEGILFIEADADARLEDFGESPLPPIPHLGELLFNVKGSGGVLNTPVLLVQVTRLTCGGFVLAIRLNHTMTDAFGLVQFLTAVAELARGAPHPSVQPVWKRELLGGRSPPRVTCFHREFEKLSVSNAKDTPFVDLVEKSIFFGPKEIKNIRDHHLPAHLRNRPAFEIVTALLWKCRTATLLPDCPDEEVRIIFPVNARPMFKPPIPLGYYGNVFAFPAASATAANLCRGPLGYALELVKKAKLEVTEEYMRSLVDLLVIRDKPRFRDSGTHSFYVSDLTRVGYEMVDFGWGPAVYGGPAKPVSRGVGSFCIPSKNSGGEKGMPGADESARCRHG